MGLRRARSVVVRSAHRERVRALVRPHRRQVALLALFAVTGGALEAFFLVLITRTALAVTDGADTAPFVGGRDVSVSGALAIAAGLLAVRLALALAGARTSAHLAFVVLTTIRRRLASAFLHASWATQQAEPSGQLQNLTGFAANAFSVVSAFAMSTSAVLNLVALIAVALVIDPVATLAVVGALVLLGGVLAPLRSRIRARGATAATGGMRYSATLAELGALGLEMQAYGVRTAFADRIDALSVAEATARRRAGVLQGALVPVYTTLAYGALLGALAVAAAVGASELSAVGAVMLVMLRSLTYGQQLQGASGALQSSVPYLEKVDEVLARYEADRATGGTVRTFDVAPIEAADVSFAYAGDRPVLSDVRFRIERHEIIGIVGPSGAGKSTLVQLLLGLRDPTAGAITVGGVDLRTVDRDAWTRRVAFVAQDARLFTGTVTDNIRFARPDIDDEMVRTAARLAHLTDDLERLPEGFDTWLGERGEQLSGGQRQRVSIARALAGRPELLILDEPTSALDTRSESLIRETVAGLRGTTTVVVIAHRLSTLDVCDRIMVIEGGRMTAFGTPIDLRDGNDFYRRALELSGLS